METLMTVFSGVAALMCLLVGLQLLSLETRIDQAAESGNTQFKQWGDEVHTGAVMSFGAGALILLFGLRHQATRSRSASRRPSPPQGDDEATDLDSLSIRIFEVDAEDRTIEITDPEEEFGEIEFQPEPRIWAPLAEDGQDNAGPPADAGDPTDSILNSIMEASGSNVPDRRNPPADKPARSFWSRIFGTHR